jgi:hypothetical protein
MKIYRNSECEKCEKKEVNENITWRDLRVVKSSKDGREHILCTHCIKQLKKEKK